MSAESVQFAEMVRIEHARIEYLKQAADERGGFQPINRRLADMVKNQA